MSSSLPAPATHLDQSCVVEASAGTGKTTALVARIVDVIALGVPVQEIVAVTFTHAAAGNMKWRVRDELERRRSQELEPVVAERLALAARSLDRAFIGTIHSFCAQLLRRRPVEAGVDPDFKELTQPDAMRVFRRVFREWIERRLAAPSPALRRALARLALREERDGNAPLEDLRHAAWMLAEWRDFDGSWQSRPFDRDAGLNALVQLAEATVALRGRCAKTYDALYTGLQPLAEFVERVRRASQLGNADPDVIESEILRLPNDLRWLQPGHGHYGDGVTRQQVHSSWSELADAIEQFRQRSDADLAVSLREDLWEVVSLYQQEKTRAGQVDFMDLLLLARKLVLNDAARRDLQRRYSRILIDEFQDTDPLQAEILILLACADPAGRDWQKAVPVPGKLWAVGDPKQSIYRFRRADARQYRRILDQMSECGVRPLGLHRSTRSTTTIQSFINAAFRSQMGPEYPELEGGVPPVEGQPGVVALPMPEPYGSRNISKAQIDKCSPNAVAAFIEWLLGSNWKIRDRISNQLVNIQAEHICILFRRFTNWGADLTQEYVRSLEARGIAHVLVGSKSFHAREEVGALRTALRAIEWPDDELSVFAVLRGNLFAFTDDVLLRFKQTYRRFHPLIELPEDTDPEFTPVRAALGLLAGLHRRRNYRPVAETVNDLLEAARAHVAFAFRKGGERVLANVYRLTDLARSFEASSAATSFRAFVEYLEAEYEGSDTPEAPVLEQQAEGVQLMTVHRAKGLEFPVVILADLTARLTSSQGGDRYLDTDGRVCAQRLLHCAPWELLEHASEEAEADRQEALRLAYVAATRARDLLVVTAVGEQQYDQSWLTPLYDALYPPSHRWRTAAPAPGCPQVGDSTVLNRPLDRREEVSVRPGLHVPKTGTHQVAWLDPHALPLAAPKTEGIENEHVLSATPDQASAGLRLYNDWKEQRRSVIDRGSSPAFHLRTAHAIASVPEAQTIPVETVTIHAAGPRPKGWKFGKIVHEILEHADGPGDVDTLAAIYGRKNGATQAEIESAAEAVRRALEHPALAAIAGQRIHRELPLAVKLNDGTLVEGIADLACSDGASWTVVDYKTNREEDRNIAQLQLYGWALQRATGLPARGMLLEI